MAMAELSGAEAAIFFFISLFIGILIKVYGKIIPVPYTVILFLVGIVYSGIAEGSKYIY